MHYYTKWYVKRRKKEEEEKHARLYVLFYSKNVDYCSLWVFWERLLQFAFFSFSNKKTTVSVTKSTVTLIWLLAIHIALSFNYIRTTWTYIAKLLWYTSIQSGFSCCQNMETLERFSRNISLWINILFLKCLALFVFCRRLYRLLLYFCA